MEINYEELPQNLRLGMQRYIEHGIPPGSFLEAVIQNKLIESFRRADEDAQMLLPEIIKWILKWMPYQKFGAEGYKNWTRECFEARQHERMLEI